MECNDRLYIWRYCAVLNFEVICTIGIRNEFRFSYTGLADAIDEKKKIAGLDLGFYIYNTDEEIIKDFPTMSEIQIEAHDIRFGKCLISFDSNKISSLNIGERFILKKWEEFCPSSIYDINPETDTEDRYWERRNSLKKVHNIFSKYTYYSKNLSNAFAIATEYFEFVEQNNKQS